MSCEHRQPAPATRNCYTWKMLTLCLCSQEPAKPRRTTLPVFLERLVSSSLLKTVRQQNIDSWQLLLFLSSQHETLHQHLLSHGYVINQNKKDRIFFFFKFSTSWFMLSYHKLKDAFFFCSIFSLLFYTKKVRGKSFGVSCEKKSSQPPIFLWKSSHFCTEVGACSYYSAWRCWGFSYRVCTPFIWFSSLSEWQSLSMAGSGRPWRVPHVVCTSLHKADISPQDRDSDMSR